MALNQIVLMGRMTRDPELRYTQSQTPVVSFALAVDRDFTEKGQERKTDFIDCVAWRGTAEFVSKYFQKGSMVALTGRLQTRDYTDKDGHKRKVAEVVADHVYFAESKRKNDEDSYAASERAGRSAASAGYVSVEYDDGDLPEDGGTLPF